MSSLDSMAPLNSDVHRSLMADIPKPSPSYETICPETAATKAKKDFWKRGVPAAPSPSRFSPWMLTLAYPLGRYGLLPCYFEQIDVTGREHLPTTGPVILAPTHRSRWDALLVPYAAGHDITGRHLRFMVSADEVVGAQGWLIRRMGGFPINTKHPAIASLRHGVELLQHGEVLVIFPEGNIFRDIELRPLKPGLARLALQAQANHVDLGIKIVPISIHYNHPMVPWRSRASIHIGTPLQVADYHMGSPKQNAQQLTAALEQSLNQLVAVF